ncbi:LLM class flavin-dependent oxidoreductase [Aquabacterium soli]|uniref:Luciferase-like monooxygenase n=1 Tax=Aquabacterium soli TaxID=2493092 RepID=A0A3R8TWE6_9BURK|nr:LLM class flavin-dependent oxidoreductase [Aquabacterium soli]RRS06258.1 LLM class flavin-dependent oxidoreductase [Aquabacterium soli]
MSSAVPLSVLDLSPIALGSTASQALQHTLELARQAERCGFDRFWLAEHHNMPGIASAATSVVIGHVAGGTARIRVGAGGIMLPNHSPLTIAEQFGTLESLYPGRIDLGLGRAPGADQLTARAMRRDPVAAAERFPDDVQELQRFFEPDAPGQRLRAYPGSGLRVPLWILGSSLYGAQLAAALGLPYAFASHFAPEQLDPAIEIYRHRFQPSAAHATSRLMLTVNVVVADTDEQARHAFTSVQQSFLNLRRGLPGQVPPPVDTMDGRWTPEEKAGVDRALRHAFVGSPATVLQGLRRFLDTYRPDELMVTAHLHDQKARLRSLELLSGMQSALSLSPAV